MIFNLVQGQIPATHLPRTAEQIAAELTWARAHLARLEEAEEIFSQPLGGPLELEVVIPEEDPKHIRGWAMGTDLARVFRKAMQMSKGRRGNPHVFVNFGGHSIAISPADLEGESRMRFSQHTERHDHPATAVWTQSNRGKVYLARPSGS